MGFLPTEKTKPKVNLADLTILLYGPSKIGKSTFCSEIPDALFLRTEDGLKALEVFETPISTWKDFMVACAEIQAGKHPFKAVVIDTLDNLFKICSDFVCPIHGIKTPDDLDFGRGYELVNNELFRALTKLSLLPYGLWMVSHSQDKEFKTRTGKITKTVPTLKNSTVTAVNKMVDFILFCDYAMVIDKETQEEKEIRVIRTKSSNLYTAGDRFTILPDPLPLDYKTFKKWFDMGMSARAQGKRVDINSVKSAEKPSESTSDNNSTTPTPSTPSKKKPAGAATK